jgi:hypothetical protein
MFIFPRSAAAVLLPLAAVALVVLVSGCAQTPPRMSHASTTCPAGAVEVYTANGPDRNAAKVGCQNASKLESSLEWLRR